MRAWVVCARRSPTFEGWRSSTASTETPGRWSGLMWERREFENYVATRQTLERYAAASGRDATPGTLFAESEQSRRVAAMNRSIESIEEAMKKLGKGFPLGSRRQGQRRFPYAAVR